MQNTKTALLYGFVIWLVPFAVAIPFYSRDGELMVDILLFKTVMLLAGSLTGAVCLVRYFKLVNANLLREGVVIGLVWFTISLVLDLIILVPLNDMALGTYFVEIGLRYLTIPIFAIAFGVVLQGRAA